MAAAAAVAVRRNSERGFRVPRRQSIIESPFCQCSTPQPFLVHRFPGRRVSAPGPHKTFVRTDTIAIPSTANEPTLTHGTTAPSSLSGSFSVRRLSASLFHIVHTPRNNSSRNASGGSSRSGQSDMARAIGGAQMSTWLDDNMSYTRALPGPRPHNTHARRASEALQASTPRSASRRQSRQSSVVGLNGGDMHDASFGAALPGMFGDLDTFGAAVDVACLPEYVAGDTGRKKICGGCNKEIRRKSNRT